MPSRGLQVTEPCGRSKLKVSIKQRRKGAAASIDVFQQTTEIDWGYGKLDKHRLANVLLKFYEGN